VSGRHIVLRQKTKEKNLKGYLLQEGPAGLLLESTGKYAVGRGKEGLEGKLATRTAI